jgi:hypothetical protein
MNRLLVSIVSTTALLMVLGTTSAAQAQERGRWWAGIAVGVGSLDASSRPDGGSRDTVGVSVINVGWWLNQRWQLGVDFSGPDIESVANLGASAFPASFVATAAFYPNQASGFYLKGGAGGSAVFVDIVDEFGTKATAFSAGGPAFMAGTGWDFYLGRRFWLTPALTYRYSHPGDLLMAGRTRVANWSYSTIDFTVGVRFD